MNPFPTLKSIGSIPSIPVSGSLIIEQITQNLGDHDAIFFSEMESAFDLLNIFDCIGFNILKEVKVISLDGTFEEPKNMVQASMR
tara:strand:+ start:265 stop:519 length:255 start_codon:yes stop_codon:yes gene_type:complete